MFPMNETVLNGETAYRREQLMAARPVRRRRMTRATATGADRASRNGSPAQAPTAAACAA